LVGAVRIAESSLAIRNTSPRDARVLRQVEGGFAMTLPFKEQKGASFNLDAVKAKIAAARAAIAK
jgi:hypothetical protein